MNEIEKIEIYVKGLHKEIIDKINREGRYWSIPEEYRGTYKIIYGLADIIGERSALLKYENENLQMHFLDKWMFWEGRTNTEHWPDSEKEFWGIT